MDGIPVTEQRNVITSSIDVASPIDILRMLYKCDQEIFNGWRGSKGLFDKTCLQIIENIANEVATLLQHSDSNAVVMSGSGTSGRLALMVARTFNSHLASRGLHPCYNYLMSGGDRASFQAQEAPEDDPFSGKAALEKACEGKQRSMLIGVTCGLSAAYVAGQLDACMGQLPSCVPALVGFNPVHLARKTAIENWNQTFYTVVSKLDEEVKKRKAFILTPIIGPEPISGSTRMKSGSATKIILETILTAAHQMAFHSNLPCSIPSLIKAYELVMEAVYVDRDWPILAKILRLAGDSLNKGGHIYYVAANSLGLVAMVDASECPPTFGADLNDVRGFVKGGYDTLANKEGDLSEFMAISTEYFEKEIATCLSQDDLIVFLVQEDSYRTIAPMGSLSKAKKVVIHFGRDTKHHPNNEDVNGCIEAFLRVLLPWNAICQLIASPVVDMCEQLYYEMACKWVCNAISTSAHIQRGKVYENVMVDVKVSNTKLFYRAIGIVALFARCSNELALEALLKSIYETDQLTSQHHGSAPSAHIRKASPMNKVVPVALMLAITRCTVSRAVELLKESSVIRTAINNCIHASNDEGDD